MAITYEYKVKATRHHTNGSVGKDQIYFTTMYCFAYDDDASVKGKLTKGGTPIDIGEYEKHIGLPETADASGYKALADVTSEDVIKWAKASIGEEGINEMEEGARKSLAGKLFLYNEELNPIFNRKEWV
tara:strand:+ start:542 stop:928 length:387 start_codon:yes stop_codon:yes gene_type:complete